MAVVDAETLKLDDGSELRLIGALAPRLPDGAGEDALRVWPPEAALREDLETSLVGRSVELAFSGRRRDRYGQLLAQVFVLSGEHRDWLQGRLVERGLARAYGLPGRFACIEDLLAREKLAFSQQRGLWRNARYQVRQAERTAGLMRYRHSYQIVEGIVRKVADVRGTVYLNFGEDWRRDFTVALSRQVQRRQETPVASWESLQGRRIRVRGWIERRNGPYIALEDMRLLEIEPAPSLALPASLDQAR